MLKPLSIALLLALLAVPVQAQPYKIFVYATPAEGGFTDGAVKEREASALDIRKELAEKGHRDMFTLVDSLEAADFALEVEWRGPVTTDQTTGSINRVPNTDLALASSSAITQNNIKTTLTVGTYSREMWALTPGSKDWMGGVKQRMWKQQAGELAKSLERWARENGQPIAVALQAAKK